MASDPMLSNAAVAGRLAANADPVGTRLETGNGRLNLGRALTNTAVVQPVVPIGVAGRQQGGPFLGPYLAAASTAQGPTLVGTYSASNATPTITVPAGGVPAGALLVMVASQAVATTTGSWCSTACSDNHAGSTNVYTVANEGFVASTSPRTAIIYSPITTALTSGNVITINRPVTGNNRSVVDAFYFTGVQLTSPLDVTGKAAAATSPASVVTTTGTAGQTTASDLVVAGIGTIKSFGAASACTASSTAGTANTLINEALYTLVAASGSAQTCTTAVTAGAWSGAIATFKVDVTPPTVAMTFPSATAYTSGTWTGTLTGTAADTTTSAGINSGLSSVTVSIEKDNNTAQCWNGTTGFAAACPNPITMTGTTSWSKALASSSLTEGSSYAVTATAIDNATNSSTTATDTFTYDNTAPLYASSATSADGTKVDITYTEAGSGLKTSSVATGQYAVKVNTVTRSISAASVLNNTTVELTLSSRVYGADSVTVLYTDPGSGTRLQDNAGNLVVTDGAAKSVTNSSASLANSTTSAAPNSITADGSSTSTITVQLKDGSNANLSASGGAVTVSTTTGTFPGPCNSGCATTDNGNGTYTATLTSPTSVGSGTASVTSALDGSSFTSAAASVTLVAGTPTHLLITGQVSRESQEAGRHRGRTSSSPSPPEDVNNNGAREGDANDQYLLMNDSRLAAALPGHSRTTPARSHSTGRRPSLWRPFSTKAEHIRGDGLDHERHVAHTLRRVEPDHDQSECRRESDVGGRDDDAHCVDDGQRDDHREGRVRQPGEQRPGRRFGQAAGGGRSLTF